MRALIGTFRTREPLGGHVIAQSQDAERVKGRMQV